MKTMSAIFRKLLKDRKHTEWEKMLLFVGNAYRGSIHSTTMHSPYYVLHARDPTSLLDLALDLKTDPMGTPDDYISQTLERLRFTFQKVREATANARLQQRDQYNKRASEMNYRRGDKVLLDVRVVKDGEYHKWTSKYKGP